MQKKNFHVIDSNPVLQERAGPEGWPADNSVELERVTLGFDQDQLVIVKQIDLRIESGESIVVCGRDGSGKSSLLAAICGIIRPIKNIDGSVGCVRIGGYNIRQLSQKSN